MKLNIHEQKNIYIISNICYRFPKATILRQAYAVVAEFVPSDFFWYLPCSSCYHQNWLYLLTFHLPESCNWQLQPWDLWYHHVLGLLRPLMSSMLQFLLWSHRQVISYRITDGYLCMFIFQNYHNHKHYIAQLHCTETWRNLSCYNFKKIFAPKLQIAFLPIPPSNLLCLFFPSVSLGSLLM